MAIEQLPFTLDQRLGLGRLRAAVWLDDQTVLVATQAALWRWIPLTGAVTPFAELGATLLTVNCAAGLAAVAVDCPARELVVLALAEGREVRRLPGHGGAIIQCLALAPDGRLLASGGSDRMLRIRDLATGAELLTLEHAGGFLASDGSPDAVAWSPDGERIVTADNEKRLSLWDVATGALLWQQSLPLRARAVAFAPDGYTLVTGLDFGGGTLSRQDRFVAVVDAQTGALLTLLDTPTPDDRRGEDVWAVAFSPDGQFCAVGDDNGALHVFDTHTWKRVFHHQDQGEAEQHLTLSGLAYAPDGARLLAVYASEVNLCQGEMEFALEVWDARAWTLTARLDDFVSTVNDLALLTGGDLLAATDEGLRRYTAAGTYTTILPGNSYRVAAAPDGRQAVVGYRSFKGEAVLLDLQTGAVSEPLPGLTQALINSVAFLSDSRRYIVCHDNYWLRQVGRKGALKKLTPQEASRVAHLRAAVSADGKVALVSWNGTFTVLWGDKFAQSTGWLAQPGLSRRLNAAAFSPDGQQVAAAGGFYQRGVTSADRRGRVFIWQLPELTVRELITPAANRWFEAIAWAPDGALLAAGTRNGVICYFDAVRGDFLGEIAAHGAEVTALCFTPAGRLISASDDGSIGIWEDKALR